MAILNEGHGGNVIRVSEQGALLVEDIALWVKENAVLMGDNGAIICQDPKTGERYNIKHIEPA